MRNLKKFLLANLLLAVSTLSLPGFAQVNWHENCRQTVIDYAYYRDRPDADAVANLFTLDGRFKIGAEVFTGREAIRARVEAGKDGPTYRHMMSTIKLFALSDDTATGVSYATVYAGDGASLPVQVADFLALGEYHDTFERVEGACKIKSREFVRVMIP